ncbi:lipase family protein [Mycoplasmopsis glycophila]|uniref:Fungal lipase-type domain-containing protein n=1 Tax=Mycoplasmopsis glycophila TaxID=171285 RepID=A0A449AWQ0_9BACT|nr:hypothetical protein [Mycoplasmopsis glycophila]VEU71204.1 Uncharacterised protein [Mycoplasmopsis glycophila]
MRKNNKLKLLLVSLSALGSFFVTASTNETYENIQPLTSETAQKIYAGEISMADGYYDSSLIKTSILNPDGDDDEDGLLNKEEVYTYEKDSKLYYGLNSHPHLADTDGDGITDDQDTHKLSWDLSDRDMLFFQELAYRNKSVLFYMFNNDNFLDFKDNVQQALNLEKQGKYSGENQRFMLNAYTNMQYEFSRYWQPVYSFDESNGYQATWFTNQSDFPFIESQTLNVLAIAGTNNPNDFDDDIDLAAGAKRPSQLSDNINKATWYWQDWNIRKKFFNPSDPKFNSQKIKWLDQRGKPSIATVGHSLGGYLANGYAALLLENKKDNSYSNNYLGAWSFNAPAIKDSSLANYVNTWIREGKSHNFVTAQDNMPSHFSNAITVGDGGHTNKSFFKKPIVDKYFVNGIRKGSETILNPQPQLKDLALAKQILSVNYIRNNSTLKSFESVFTSQVKYKNKIQENIPKGYKFKDENALNNLSLFSQNLEIVPINHKIVYNFTFNGRPVHTFDQTEFTVNVETNNYKVPSIPPYPSSITKRYAIKGYDSVPIVTDFTKDSIFNLELIEVENKATTKITFVDHATNKQIGEKLTATTYPGEDIYWENAWNDVNYRLLDPESYPTWGKENIIDLELIPFEQNIIFKMDNKEIGREQFITKVTDQLHSFSLPKSKLPHKLYEQISINEQERNNTFATWVVNLREVDEPKHEVIVRLLDPLSRDVLVVQKFQKWSDEKITQSEINLPNHYEFSDKSSYDALETQDIILKRKEYTLTYQFVLEGETISTDVIETEYLGDYELPNVPSSNTNDFVYQTKNQLRKIENIDKNQTIVVELTKLQLQTTINYVWDGHNVASQELQKAPSYNIQVSDLSVPENYTLVNSNIVNIKTGQTNNLEVNKVQKTVFVSYFIDQTEIATQKITKDFDYVITSSSLSIPTGYSLKNPNQVFDMNHNHNIDLVRKEYVLTYEFWFEDHKISSEQITVSYGKEYQLPPLPFSNLNDYGYKTLNEYKPLKTVESNQVVKIFLIKDELVTTINYFDQEQNLIQSQQINKAPSYKVKHSDLVLPLNYHIENPNTLEIHTGQINSVILSKNLLETQITLKYQNNAIETRRLEIPFDEHLFASSLVAPKGYEIKDLNLIINAGQNYEIELNKKSYILTYEFRFNDKIISVNKVPVLYHESYTLPSLPSSNSNDFSYRTKNTYQPILNVEKDQEIIVDLEKDQVATTIEYLNDANEILETQKFWKAPNYQITSKDLNIPNGYALKDPNIQITIGQNNKVAVTNLVATTTFNFVDNEQLISSITLKQAQNSQIAFSSLQLPFGYLARDPQESYLAGQTYTINVEKETFTLTYEYFFENTKVASVSLKVKFHEEYNLPELPISTSNLYDFGLVDPNSYKAINNVEQSETYRIYLAKKQVETIFEYYYNDKKLGTQQFYSSSKYTPSTSDLILPAGYVLKTSDLVLESGKINQILVQEASSATTFIFKYEDQVIKTQTLERNSKNKILLTELDVPNGYVIINPQNEYDPKATYEIVLNKKQFHITYNFYYEGDLIAIEKVNVLFEGTYELPPVPNSNSDEYHYIPISNYVVLENVNEDQIVNVQLEKSTDVTTLIFVFDNKILHRQSISKSEFNNFNNTMWEITEHYIATNPNITIIKGQENIINLQEEMVVSHIVLRFKDKIIKEITITHKYNEPINLEDLDLPEEYVLPKGLNLYQLDGIYTIELQMKNNSSGNWKPLVIGLSLAVILIISSIITALKVGKAKMLLMLTKIWKTISFKK